MARAQEILRDTFDHAFLDKLKGMCKKLEAQGGTEDAISNCDLHSINLEKKENDKNCDSLATSVSIWQASIYLKRATPILWY